ncbi:aa3-type cytochrome oxidase subunit II [Nocardioides pacificus]
MGLQLPKRATRSVKRLALGAALGSSLLLVGACSTEDKDQIGRLAMPEPITETAPAIYDLWQYAWLAAMVTGVIVWGLIFWVIGRYRRRHDDEIPVQTRYNLPLEIFYTIAPILMVVVFFYWTVTVQNEVLDEVDEPDRTIEIVGQQWSWTFNHGLGEPDFDAEEGEPRYDEYAAVVGTGSEIPTLVLPEGETVQFNLHSPDVIHSFWVPGFLMKMDVVPGRINHFQVTPTKQGTFVGKCAELCGVYHARMLFNVDVVSPEEYEDYLAELEETGEVSDEPLLGGADMRTQAGLDTDTDAEGGHE